MTNFSIEKNVDGQFYATFTAENGEMIWKTSEFYTRKQKALKAIGIILSSIKQGISNVWILDNTFKKPTEKSYFISNLLRK